ncbi:MAG: tetratricopeptide repeat-containing diguanylate cyclase [Silanimonas sp.]
MAHSIGPRWWGALAIVLIVAVSLQATPPTFESRLVEADAVRNTDPIRFRELLASLQAERATALPTQIERLDYLDAHAEAYAGNFGEAIRKAARLHEGATDAGVRFRAAALIVNSAAGNRDFATGFRYLNFLTQSASTIEDRTLRHQGIGTATALLNQAGQYEDGLRYAQLLLDDEPDLARRCAAGYLKLEAQAELTPDAVGDDAVVALIDECQRSDNPLTTHFSSFQRARLMARRGDVEGARALLMQDAPAAEATGYPRLIIEVQSLLAQVNLRMGDPESAVAHAQRAVDAGQGARFSAPVVEALRILAEVARQRGDNAEALRRMGEFAEAQRGYLDEIKTRELAVQLARHQTLQQAQSLELLERQNQLLRLQQDVGGQRQTIFLLALALLAGVLGFVIYWALRVKRLQLSFQQLAETDGLTALANRAHFTALCEQRLAAANAAGRTLALVLFDLDHFKQTNDVHGHPAGDAVLRAVGAAILRALRPGMRAGRMGGEEFGLVFDADDLPTAVAIVEDCRIAIAALSVPFESTVLGVTASFGMARSNPQRREFKALLIAADAALYAAKAGGRNRLCVAPEPEAAPSLAPSRPALSAGPQGTFHG